MDESQQPILTDRQISRRELQAISRKVFMLEQKNSQADEFYPTDENMSHVLVMSKKRDAVGTGQIDATGKIAKLAVVAEYRDGMEAGIPNVLARLGI